MNRDVAALAALEDELRRQMYLEIRQRGRPVSREEVAEAVGVSRKLAAFHLDKLVDRGLLVATYARPPGRGGRGAGRSAKFYEPSDRTFDVSIPERNYDVMGSILVRAIEEERPGERADVAAQRVARRYGEDLGKAERERRHLPPCRRGTRVVRGDRGPVDVRLRAVCRRWNRPPPELSVPRVGGTEPRSGLRPEP